MSVQRVNIISIEQSADIPSDIGSVSSNFRPNLSNGLVQKILASGNLTIYEPIGGVEGQSLKIIIKASGADRVLNFENTILIPSDASVSFPQTVPNGKSYIVQLYHNGDSWLLTTFIGGY